MLKKDKTLPPNSRITFVLTEQEKIDLKIMAILTKRSMSDFIRISVKDKIKEIKSKSPIQPF
jgi:hypothetical protein